MRSVLAGLRTLVIPWGAVNPPRVVIATDDPLAQDLGEDAGISWYTSNTAGFVIAGDELAGGNTLTLSYTDTASTNFGEYWRAIYDTGSSRASLYVGDTVDELRLIAADDLVIGEATTAAVCFGSMEFDQNVGATAPDGSFVAIEKGYRGSASSVANSAAVAAETAVLTITNQVFENTRAYRISIGGRVSQSAVGQATFQLRLTNSAGTVVGIYGSYPTPVAGSSRMAHGECYVKNDSGADITANLLLMLIPSAGTATHVGAANAPRYLQVNDVGNEWWYDHAVSL